jgi:1,4-dihydroxy-2-naphthoate octaprenyltransferase
VVVGTAAGYLTTGHFFVITGIHNGHVVSRSSMPVTHSFSPVNAILALAVALALQIGTNYVNDYADGVRGTDEVRAGPVRLVAGKLASVRQVKSAALSRSVWPE